MRIKTIFPANDNQPNFKEYQSWPTTKENHTALHAGVILAGLLVLTALAVNACTAKLTASELGAEAQIESLSKQFVSSSSSLQ